MRNSGLATGLDTRRSIAGKGTRKETDLPDLLPFK
ncbi:hypothetical protein QFZ58_004309 [Streptomyces sp. B1I3]|nr:hypothetical protein [Streptomyces sp. B1I3]